MLKHTHIIFGISVTLLGLGLAGCSRAHQDTSSLKISAPSTMFSSKVGGYSVSAQSLSHLVINISGSGINPTIVAQFDTHDGDAAIPSPVVIDNVPRGNDRTVQVLAVYADSSSSSTSIYYGNQNASFSSDSVDVPVTINQIGGGSLLSGHVGGRYVTGVDAGGFDTGPSGPVQVKFFPTGSTDGLIIERDMIYNGWFDFFMLDGSGFTLGYQLPDGSLMWGKSINLSDSSFTTAPNVAKVALPVHMRNDNWSGTASWSPEDASEYVYGWFGPGASVGTKHVCVPSTLSTLSRMDVFTTGTPSLGLTGAMGLPSLSNLLSTSSPLTNYFVAGGLTSCPVGDIDFAQKLDLGAISSMIDGQGSDGASFAYPPLMPQTVGTSRGAFSLSATAMPLGARLKGQFLPGIHPALIDGMQIFKRVANDQWRWNSGSAPCGAISKSQFSFAPATGAVFNFTTGDQFQVDVPLTAAEEGTGVTLAACYTRGGTLTGDGTLVYSDNLRSIFGGGMNVPMSPPTHIFMALQDNMTALRANICVPATVQLLDANSKFASGFPTTYTVNFTPTSANVFTDITNCGHRTYPISSLSMSSGQVSQIVFVNATSSSGGSVVVSDSSSTLTGTTVSFTGDASGTTLSKYALIDAQPGPNSAPTTLTGLQVGVCKSVILQMQDTTTGPTGNMAGTGMTFLSSSMMSMNVYDPMDNYCSGSTMANIPFPSDGTYTFSSTFINVRPSSGFSLSSGSFNSTGVTPRSAVSPGAVGSSPVNLSVEVAGAMWNNSVTSVPRGVCLPVRVTQRDMNNGLAVTAVGADQTVLLAVQSGGTTPPTASLYSAATCSSGASSSQTVVFSPTAPEQFVWLMVSGGSVDSQIHLQATVASNSITAGDWPNASSTGSLTTLQLNLAYQNMADQNMKWVPLQVAPWSGAPPALTSTCRQMNVNLVDSVTLQPYYPPTPIQFTASRAVAPASSGFLATCGGGVSNSYVINPGQTATTIAFDPSTGSLTKGTEQISLTASNPSILSSPILEMGVGLKLNLALTTTGGTPSANTATCYSSGTQRALYMSPNVSGTFPLTPPTDLGAGFTGSYSFTVVGITGSATIGVPAACGSAAVPIDVASSIIGFSFDTTSATDLTGIAVTGTPSGTYSSWLTNNVVIVLH